MSVIDKISITKEGLSTVYNVKDADSLRSAALTNVENGDTASKAYVVNDLLYRNDTLYKVLVAIPQGGSFTVGVNIRQTILTNELANLSPSVIANPAGTATDDLSTVQIGNTIYNVEGGGGTTVVPNPADPATDELETIQIGDTVYSLPEDEITDVQVNGTSVVENGVASISIQDITANPEEEATADLTKIQIGNTIYGIEGGSPGASITYGTTNPSGGEDGDVYLKYGVPSNIYKYIRLDVTDSQSSSNDDPEVTFNHQNLEFDGFKFVDENDTPQAWPEGTVAKSASDRGGYQSEIFIPYTYIINEQDVDNKYVNLELGYTPSFIITLPDEHLLDISTYYKYKQNNHDCIENVPRSQKLYVSNDAENWIKIDDVNNFIVPEQTWEPYDVVYCNAISILPTTNILNIYLKENGTWIKDSFNSSSSSGGEIIGNDIYLESLKDVTLNNTSNGQPLTYDAEIGAQINTGIIPITSGGTGNNTGYVRAGQKAGSVIGEKSTAEGYDTVAKGGKSHAEGIMTSATGEGAHSEGQYTSSAGYHTHTEGEKTTATGSDGHAEGGYTYASGFRSHAEGEFSTANGQTSHAEGNKTYAIGDYSHTEGYYTTTYQGYAHAEGAYTSVVGYHGHGEGHRCTAYGESSHAEGEATYAGNDYAHTEGRSTCAAGQAAHAEGYQTKANGNYSHTEGTYTTVGGEAGHAEGCYTYATSYAHAEGSGKAYGSYAHAEGGFTTAGTSSSHSEGSATYAKGSNSHAEGGSTTAEGSNSHSQNQYTKAIGDNSSAAGESTVAGYKNQFVIGKFNDNKATSLFEVGNGTNSSNTANALELDAEGNLLVSGTVTDGEGHVLGEGGGASTLTGLTDTNITQPSDGQILKYDDTTSKQINVNNSQSSTITYGAGNPSGGMDTDVYMKLSGAIPARTYRYIKFEIDTVQNNGNNVDINGFAFEDINNNKFNQPEGTTVTCNVGTAFETINLFTDDSNDYIRTYSMPSIFTITLPQGYPLDILTYISYRQKVAVYNQTSPKTQKLYLSNNEEDQIEIDNITDYVCTASTGQVGFSGSFTPPVTAPTISDVYVKAEGLQIKDDFGEGGFSIDVITENIEDSSTSSKAYAIDDYLYKDDVLYKVKAAIAQGDTFVVDTNIEATTVTDELGNGGGGLPEDPLSIAHGGTGNNSGYIQTGRKTNTTVGDKATIEGDYNTGSGSLCHVEGYNNTVAIGAIRSHVGGFSSTVSNQYAFAHGYGCNVSGKLSTAFGSYINTGYENQFAIGKYNNNSANNIFEVGIGTGSGATPRINGLELDTSGNLKVAGTITDGNGNVLNQHFDQTVTLSTSAQTTATFTNAVFTTDTCVDIALTEQGLVPDDVVVTTGSCTVTLPIVDTARSITVRVYVR